ESALGFGAYAQVTGALPMGGSSVKDRRSFRIRTALAKLGVQTSNSGNFGKIVGILDGADACATRRPDAERRPPGCHFLRWVTTSKRHLFVHVRTITARGGRATRIALSPAHAKPGQLALAALARASRLCAAGTAPLDERSDRREQPSLVC